MTPAPGLIPTPVVDKRGRQTTVYKKPQDGAQGLQNAIPAPAAPSSGSRPSRELVERVSALFPTQRHEGFMKIKLPNLSVEAVELVGKCAEKLVAKAIDETRSESFLLSDLVYTVTGIDGGVIPEESLPFLLRGIDSITDEFKFSDLKTIYLKSMHGSEPAPDNVLDAHVIAGHDYFESALNSEHNIPFSYIDNEVVFDLVARHPDKADIIIKHRETYHPEANGTDEFEADLERISELNKSISEGWL
jgi:hypothetical protein